MLVQVPSGWDAVAWLQREERYSTPSLGFSFFYHQRHDQSKTSPGRVPCRLCKGGRRAGEDAITSLVRRHSCLALVAALAGSSEPTVDVRRSVRPTAPELLLRELFAGRAVLTAEWERQGGRALQPVEVFEEPHTREGYRAEHDLLRPEVREAHLLSHVHPIVIGRYRMAEPGPLQTPGEMKEAVLPRRRSMAIR